MINSKKKGFTIVELVIVIAVVAILAAVLIPTFSNLVKKANLSADQQTIRNMNTTLATYTDTEKEISDIMAYLRSNGFSYEKMVAYSKGYHYCYSKTTNQMYLLNDKDVVIFPADANIALSDLWAAYGDHETYIIDGITQYYAIKEITSQEEFNSSFASGSYKLDLNNNLCTVNGNANVSVMNGSVIGAGFTSSENVIKVEESNSNNTVTTKNEDNKITKITYTNVLNPSGVSSSPASYYVEGAYVEYENCVFTEHAGFYQNGQGFNLSFKNCTFINISTFAVVLQPGNSIGKTSTVEMDECNFINCDRGIHVSAWENTTVNITNCTFALKTGNSAYNCIQISVYANDADLSSVKINFTNNKVLSAFGVVYFHDGMKGPQNIASFKGIINFTGNTYAENISKVADRNQYSSGHILYQNETAMNELASLIK